MNKLILYLLFVWFINHINIYWICLVYHLANPLELLILDPPFRLFYFDYCVSPNWASSYSGDRLLFNALSRSSYAYFCILEVFYNLWINSYSSFSNYATIASISIRLLFSSKILFINLLRCPSRFSCRSYINIKRIR